MPDKTIAHAMKRIKLFLVDDHQIMIDGLQAFLDKEPQIEIIGIAHNGEEALDCLKKHHADVVVLDISMPGDMDGLETAKQIKRSLPDTKIILLTMFGEGPVILKALRIGIHGYVLKDKSKETLLAAIYAVLNGNSYFSPDLLKRIAEDTEDDDSIDNVPVKLTKREMQIICLMAKEPSLTAEQLGERLFIAGVTVQTHIRNAKDKLGMSRSAELILYAKEKKLCG